MRIKKRRLVRLYLALCFDAQFWAAKRIRQEHERERVRSGKNKQSRAFLISKDQAKRAVIHYKP
ncbi:MAG: hypothetical protein ACXWIN_07945 [Burkholderiaceae bacterium]